MNKNHESLKKILESLIAVTPFRIESTQFEFNELDGSYWFTLTTNEPHAIIGKDGEVLYALTTLARRIIEEEKEIEEPRPQIVIEVNDYQKKKIENLKTIAHMMSERAKYFKSSISIDPMNAYERKIIHSFLQDRTDIKTESEGVGRNRHIVIKYIGEI